MERRRVGVGQRPRRRYAGQLSTPREPLSPWPIVGLVGLACVAFLIGATPVVVGAPWWAVLLLALVWLGALMVAIAWFATRPRAVVLLPAVVAAAWLATVLGGAKFLDWG